MHTNPTDLGWEAWVDRHMHLIDLCLTTENYGPLHALAASKVTDAHDPRVHLVQARGSVTTSNHPSENDLMQVGIELIHSIEQFFESQLDSFAAIARKHPHPERLEKAAEKLVDSFHGHNKEVFARAHDQGKNIIRQLPKQEHDPLSRLFTAMFDAPSSLVEQQSRQVKTIFDTVWNNPRRVPVQVTRAFASNRAAADVAYKWEEEEEEKFVGSDDGGMEFVDDALTGLDPDVERLSFVKTENGWTINGVPS
ncbi:hypothetical protein SLS58_007798 [Diplodia intermedia]|uniref:Uncharacterized protein n=1 Tax=Diplodia intermedia TaxID=856260 RepID=A0ABR3TK50_9PEZI